MMREILIQDTEKDKPFVGFQLHVSFLMLSSWLPPSNPLSQVFKVFGEHDYFSWKFF